VSERFDQLFAEAILGIDTLWGGDVMCPSGTGRFIADSWFSDEPLPAAYTDPSAARVRATGGVSAKAPDREAIESYLAAVDVEGSIRGLAEVAREMEGLRGAYVQGLAGSIEVMWDLVQEMLGAGPAVDYERCVRASTGQDPTPSAPEPKRERVAELLGRAGHRSGDREGLLAAVDAWRRERLAPLTVVRPLGAAFIAQYDQLCAQTLLPHLPAELAPVPRANIQFLPIREAWFSGSMNYLGRARRADGRPEDAATYEINASLEISLPGFVQLVAHEVVPGHVSTFAYLQDFYVRG